MRWAYNLHRAIECIEKIIDPNLDLRFRVRGHRLEILLNREVIWTSIAPGVWYGQASHAAIAKLIFSYYSMPVSELRNKKMPKFPSWWASDQALMDNFKHLPQIIRAADRRLGKDFQSLMLFSGGSEIARRIIVQRL